MALITDGLTHYYRLDESSNDRFDGMDRVHIKFTNNPGNVSGKVGSAVRLNGSSQRGAIPHIDYLNMRPQDEFSVAFWYRGTANFTGGRWPLLGKFNNSVVTERGWTLFIDDITGDAVPRLRFRVCDVDTGNYVDPIPDADLPEYEPHWWYLCVVTYQSFTSGSNLTNQFSILNLREDHVGASDLDIYSALYENVGGIETNSEPVIIGGGQFDIFRYFPGDIDNLVFWNRDLRNEAVSPSRPIEMFNDGMGLDFQPTSIKCTDYYGGIKGYWKLNEEQGNSRLDHINDYDLSEVGSGGVGHETVKYGNGATPDPNHYLELSVAEAEDFKLSEDQEFSFACWAKFDNIDPSGNIQVVAGKWASSQITAGINVTTGAIEDVDSRVADDEWCIYYDATVNRFALAIRHADGNEVTVHRHTGISPQSNTLYHLVGTFKYNSLVNRSELRLWVNGNGGSGTFISGGGVYGRGGDSAFRIGKAGDLPGMTGAVDDSAFWHKELTRTQVQTLYAGGQPIGFHHQCPSLYLMGAFYANSGENTPLPLTVWFNGAEGDIPLHMHGHAALGASGQITLFIDGDSSASIPLYIAAAVPVNNNIPLFIKGFQASTNNIPLYIAGLPANSMPLYIGSGVSFSQIPLYIHGVVPVTDEIPLFIEGHDDAISTPPDEFITLFLYSDNLGIGRLPLVVHSDDTTTLNDVPLYIPGVAAGVNHFYDVTPLYMDGEQVVSTDKPFPLFINVLSTGLLNNKMNMFLKGVDITTSIPLVLFNDTPNNFVNLYVRGKRLIGSDPDDGTDDDSLALLNTMPLFMNRINESTWLPLFLKANDNFSTSSIPLYMNAVFTHKDDTTLAMPFTVGKSNEPLKFFIFGF